MNNKIHRNLAGMRFGRLVAKTHDFVIENGVRRSAWHCLCDCGNKTLSKATNLIHGTAKSCGCKRKDSLNGNKHLVKHGDAKRNNFHPLLRRYFSMRKRCENQNDPEYYLYGGRGIKVCIEWMQSYPSFKQWALSNGFSKSLTIDRIDVNGDYSPSNCRWVTQMVNTNNRRNTVRVFFNGKQTPLADLCRELGISHKLAYSRLRRGHAIESIVLNLKQNSK